MVSEIEAVARRLVRRALAVMYLSIGGFALLAWVWRSAVGTITVAAIYIALASALYSHVFRPVLRVHALKPLLARRGFSPRFVRALASAVSCVAMVALVASALRLEVRGLMLAPLLGASSALLASAMLVYALRGSRLSSASDILAASCIGLAVLLYVLTPSLALPVVGSAMLGAGCWSYALYRAEARVQSP